MSAEGYQSDPLSEELERRIRARITRYRDASLHERRNHRYAGAAINDGAVAALEWVLHEAEAMKTIACELAECPREKQISIKRVCAKCWHPHEGLLECGVDLGGGGKCDCKAEVTA